MNLTSNSFVNSAIEISVPTLCAGNFGIGMVIGSEEENVNPRSNYLWQCNGFKSYSRYWKCEQNVLLFSQHLLFVPLQTISISHYILYFDTNVIPPLLHWWTFSFTCLSAFSTKSNGSIEDINLLAVVYVEIECNFFNYLCSNFFTSISANQLHDH